ncbi:MAG: hypothetical protein A2Y40_09510 [Candidatus Margulisbacteria bacterium GWF2_35_9]|nr:MAG: hypothetical protein A2Y40_09510 [Candidatus Margulisbacteria bacterium GWF2_35_9]
MITPTHVYLILVTLIFLIIIKRSADWKTLSMGFVIYLVPSIINIAIQRIVNPYSLLFMYRFLTSVYLIITVFSIIYLSYVFFYKNNKLPLTGYLLALIFYYYIPTFQLGCMLML